MYLRKLCTLTDVLLVAVFFELYHHQKPLPSLLCHPQLSPSLTPYHRYYHHYHPSQPPMYYCLYDVAFLSLCHMPPADIPLLPASTPLSCTLCTLALVTSFFFQLSRLCLEPLHFLSPAAVPPAPAVVSLASNHRALSRHASSRRAHCLQLPYPLPPAAVPPASSFHASCLQLPCPLPPASMPPCLQLPCPPASSFRAFCL